MRREWLSFIQVSYCGRSYHNKEYNAWIFFQRGGGVYSVPLSFLLVSRNLKVHGHPSVCVVYVYIQSLVLLRKACFCLKEGITVSLRPAVSA